MKRWLLIALLTGTSISGPVACGSDTPQLNDADRTEIFRILKSGVEHPTDPFVRAETMRVIELLKDPAFNAFAESSIKDSSPMVRLAALRVLLANNHADARGMALKLFNDSNGVERLAVLRATLEYAPEPVQRELIGRAIRSPDPDIRRISFEQGYIARIDEALLAGNTRYLEHTLYPELARFMNLDDPTLAARALEKFIEVGQEERVEPFIKSFARADLPLAERLKAARVLIGAGAKGAESHFDAVIERHNAILADDSLGVPVEKTSPELLRSATLGLAAIGREDMVAPAQAYLKGANLDETIEVLEALARNPSAETEVTLRVAMQDSRDAVRSRAIDLYSGRKDASPEALVRAMSNAPFATQRKIGTILRTRFKDAWVEQLKSQLQRSSEVDSTLKILRDVVVTQQEANDLLVPNRALLEAIAAENHPERSPLAAYLLALISDPLNDQAIAELDRKLDDKTRYAFIEFQVRENHMSYQRLFRVYFNADLYVIRLMSAAGMWRAGQTNAPPPSPEPKSE